jgi:hypothetical protein
MFKQTVAIIAIAEERCVPETQLITLTSHLVSLNETHAILYDGKRFLDAQNVRIAVEPLSTDPLSIAGRPIG